VKGFFKIGSQKLFAWPGFEQRCSWSLFPVARITGMGHQCLAWLTFFLVELGFELKASLLLGRCFYHLSHSVSPFFVIGFSW
jgi:hypothetical protein